MVDKVTFLLLYLPNVNVANHFYEKGEIYVNIELFGIAIKRICKFILLFLLLSLFS